jgi:putative DNA primase/helicase
MMEEPPIDSFEEFFERKKKARKDGKSSGNGASEESWTLALTRASDIEPEPISWLWPGWLARAKMHILAGSPGIGKTTIAMKIAAIVSAGGRWPDGTVAKQGNVIVWSGEDDPADTLLPRLEASGADLTRVFFAGEMTCGKERRAFDPAKDIPALEAAIPADGAALIVVDPLVSATSGDSHKNSETRRALQPLVDLAAKCKAALLGVHHFSKGSEGAHPIDRITGSVAFGAVARIVLVAAKGKNAEDGNPGNHIFMRAKSNIGPDGGGFNYDLQLCQCGSIRISKHLLCHGAIRYKAMLAIYLRKPKRQKSRKRRRRHSAKPRISF